MAGYSKHQTNSRGWEAERLVPDSVPWHKQRMISEHVVRYQFACQFVSKKDIVDLACGTGYGCQIMLQAGATSIVGIDINADAVRYARQMYHSPRINYLQRNVIRTDIPDKSVDVITSFETIEHIKKDTLFIKEVARILKPGGLFIMSTPNKEFSTGTNPYHIREYTLEECKKLLKEFSSIQTFGQRKVIRSVFNFMKKFPSITAFRPWESVNIVKLSSDAHTNYCYFVFVCQL